MNFKADETMRANEQPGATSGQEAAVGGPKSRWQISLFAALASVPPLIALIVFQLQSPQIEHDAYLNLQSIAQLKASQIENWMTDRYGDGLSLAGSSDLVEQVARLQHEGSAEQKLAVRTRLDRVRQAYGYAAVLLVDAQGWPLFALGEQSALVDATGPLLSRALTRGKVEHTELWLDKAGRAHIDFIVPLLSTEKGARHAIGAVVLRVHPEHFLYPLIKTWPTASPSAEIVLVRRDNESVVFLNELRHRQNAALMLTVPLTAPELPAAIAVRAAQPGTTAGYDYRKVRVLTAYQPVAGTDWMLVAKVDREEVIAPLWNLVFWVSLVSSVAVLLIGAALHFLWRQQQRVQGLQFLIQKEATRREGELRYRAVSESSSDAIVNADAAGTIIACNASVEYVFGYREAELVGQPLTLLIPQRFHERHNQGMRRILAGGSPLVVGRTVEVAGLHKSGSEFPLELSLAQWDSAGEQFFIGTMRDISERKLNEAKLQRLNRIYAALSHCNQLIVRCASGQALFEEICRAAVDFGGMKMAWVGMADPASLLVKPVACFGEGGEAYLCDIEVSLDAASPFGCGPIGTALREGRPLWNQDFLNDPLTLPWHERGAYFGWGSVAALPLYRNGAVIGALCLYAEDVQFFDEAIRTLLQEMAVDISLALDNFSSEAKRVAAEQAKLEAQDLLGKVAAQVPGLLFQYRLQPDGSSSIPFASEAIRDIYRLAPEQVYEDAACVLAAVHPDDRDDFASSFAVSARDLTAWRNEHRVRFADGSVRWLLGNATAQREDDGSVLWHGFTIDITERRQQEERTARLLAENETILRNALVGIVHLKDRQVVSCNRRFEEIFAYAPGELLGQSSSILFDTHELFIAVGERAYGSLCAGKDYHEEVMFRRKDGSLFWGTINGCAIDPARPLEGSIWIYSDISERVRLEEQLHDHQVHLEVLVQQRTADLEQALDTAKLADTAKDAFLANISHELRTPLNAVIGLADMARRISHDPAQQGYLDKIGNAGKSLAQLINDLLDLSKIVAGRMEFEHATFSLREVVERASSVMSYTAAGKGLQLIEKIDDQLPDVFVGDPLRIEQILLNLINNAIKFTNAGRVEVRVAELARDEGRRCLVIEIEDTGVGMREADIASLFKPFTQVDATMTRKYGGTGLGLAICKRLAEMMDGEISVTSREGQGSTFRVTLWLALGNAEELHPCESVDAPVVPGGYRDTHVLVVEDQPLNREIVEALLCRVGIIPRMACDGQQALDILDASGPAAFDLILMDVQMPVMDGLTATRELRCRTGFESLPIVAMTAHTMEHEREIGMKAGMSDHIGKPFDNAGFYRTLAKWIAGSKHLAPGDSSISPDLCAAVMPSTSSNFPSLNGIDTDAGLTRFADNEARYRHWLAAFVEEGSAHVAQIRQYLVNGSADDAKYAAHALKGRVGMLGMNDLHSVASALEAALKRGDVAEGWLGKLECAVEQTCNEIKIVLGLPDHPAQQPVSPPPDGYPAGEMPAAIAALIDMLEASDGQSAMAISRCLEEIGDANWRPWLLMALTQAQRFDFAAAVKILSNEATNEISARSI